MAYALLNGLDQGILWAILALGVFISFRMLDFADLTCEGSFAMGGAISAVLISGGTNPILSCIVAMIGGLGAGLITGVLNTKFKIPPILSGILTLTALYSINYLIMDKRASIGLVNNALFFSWIKLESVYAVLIAGLIIVGLVIAAMYWFFGTELGSAVRSTGANEKMSRAQGINTNNTKLIGLMLSNGLISLSGALVAQQQGNASLIMGSGAIVIGLASVIIGETIIPAKNSFLLTLVSVLLGSVIYRIIITLVFQAGLDTEYIKLVTAVLVVIALCLPLIKKRIAKISKWMDDNWTEKYPWYKKHVENREKRRCKRAERKAARQVK
ncbi:MAG: hypothetical protein K2I79_03175, partial [Clostridia bacterium]|nr:hypothetical protein [Clostridia bacterium]